MVYVHLVPTVDVSIIMTLPIHLNLIFPWMLSNRIWTTTSTYMIETIIRCFQSLGATTEPLHSKALWNGLSKHVFGVRSSHSNPQEYGYDQRYGYGQFPLHSHKGLSYWTEHHDNTTMYNCGTIRTLKMLQVCIFLGF